MPRAVLLPVPSLSHPASPVRPDPQCVCRHDTLANLAFPLSYGNPIFATTFRLPAQKVGTNSRRGWELYDFQREMRRLGVPGDGWRITRANESYALCPTYPQLLAVPEGVTDAALTEASHHRTKGRLPVLSWCVNYLSSPPLLPLSAPSHIFRPASLTVTISR